MDGKVLQERTLSLETWTQIQISPYGTVTINQVWLNQSPVVWTIVHLSVNVPSSVYSWTADLNLSKASTLYYTFQMSSDNTSALSIDLIRLICGQVYRSERLLQSYMALSIQFTSQWNTLLIHKGWLYLQHCIVGMNQVLCYWEAGV